MKANKGKGYFFSMGARDKAMDRGYINHRYKKWPQWAVYAYSSGYHGFPV